jgi:transcriptional regulator with XRE-family HTH domain
VRQLAGISQRELARLSGVCAAHIQAIESGRIARPNAEALQRIAGVLGIRIEYLLSGNGKSPTARSVAIAIARCRERSAAA